MLIQIVAIGQGNRVIGDNGKIPWRCSEDMKRFKKLTTGNTVVMGRTTYESIGKPLPNRRNIVLSRSLKEAPSNIELASSLLNALNLCKNDKTVFIIGGAEIYEETLNIVDYVYLSEVKGNFSGDKYYPELNKTKFKLEYSKDFEDHTFSVLRNKLASCSHAIDSLAESGIITLTK